MTASGIQFGPISLGSVPRIAGIVERPYSETELAQLYQNGVSILEFRADVFPNGPTGVARYVQETPACQKFGRLGTLRIDYPADSPIEFANSPARTGDDSSKAASRLNGFRELLPIVDAVDVEVESPERAALADLARRAGKRVVLSSHDFTKTPPPERFAAIVEIARRLEVDVLKLAVFAQNNDDLLRVLEFNRTVDFACCVTIAMGEHGLLSRIAAPFFGSPISYGFLEAANAPGQLSAAELHAEFLRFHPGYRADIDQRS